MASVTFLRGGCWTGHNRTDAQTNVSVEILFHMVSGKIFTSQENSLSKGSIQYLHKQNFDLFLTTCLPPVKKMQ